MPTAAENISPFI